MSKPNSHDEKVAVLTGVSRGIGQSLARLLKESGWSVAGCARGDDCDTELDLYQSCDVSDEDEVEAYASAVADRWQRVDLLIHNAGILGPRAALVDVPPEEWREVIDVNLTGSFLIVRAFFGLLEACEQPRVILMSSSVGRTGRGQWGPYSASKFGVEGLVDILADELSSGIVASVNPGGTATDMRAEAYPDEDPETLPTSRQVAEVIVNFVDDMHGESPIRMNVRDRIPSS